MSKIMYCLQSGPDGSHMWDYDWFEKRRDARAAIANLKPTPTGNKRPYKLERWEWQPDEVFHHKEVASTKLLEMYIDED